jgi:dCMP deaminase
MKDRISFEEMAINIAIECSKRAEDIYRKVGCCILDKEGKILSTGYNGLLPKVDKDKSFWSKRDHRRKFVIHAEINALSRINRNENPHILACTLLPCSSCALNIASYGIKKIIYLEDYEFDKGAKEIFEFYNIELLKLDTKT